MAETMRLFGGVMNRLRRLTSGCFVELSDRRARRHRHQGSSGSRRAATAGPHLPAYGHANEAFPRGSRDTCRRCVWRRSERSANHRDGARQHRGNVAARGGFQRPRRQFSKRSSALFRGRESGPLLRGNSCYARTADVRRRRNEPGHEFRGGCDARRCRRGNNVRSLQFGQ
jgi:hypothetical protein